jgi:DNA-binding beta-propeller fold protein YncE
MIETGVCGTRNADIDFRLHQVRLKLGTTLDGRETDAMKPRFARLAAICAIAGSVFVSGGMVRGVQAQRASGAASGVPRFEVDPSWQWPPKLPNNWVVGIVSFVAVDRHDNLWVLHRPRQVPVEQKDRAAPAVLQFDAAGKFVQAWGGPGPGYDWPDMEHGLSVDHQDNLWITGLSPIEGSYVSKPSQQTDDMIVKFTSKGKFIAQFGGRDRHPLADGGNDDRASVHLATEAVVYPKTNELFVSDGYANRRVLVLDAQTLAFKRMWGAFGVQPPPRLGRREPIVPTDDPEGPKVFNSVHGIKVSKDGLIYVGDRNHRRVQVFTPDGKYVAQVVVNREGKSPPVDGKNAANHMTAGSLAFSSDPDQRYLFVGDYGNGHVHIVDRKALRVIGKFGEMSGKPGDFRGLHAIDVDAKGNLWTAETQPRPVGSRVQRFIFKGVS